MSKKIACYALYGNRDFYWKHVPALVRAHHNIFPGWELRVYHDSTYWSPRATLLRAFEQAGLINVVRLEENKAHCRSMLWRTHPIWEADVDYVLSRDMDSLPTIKDRRMTEQFIQSGAALHCINDNQSHTAHVMGGMCSFYAPRFREKTGFSSWEAFVGQRGDLHHTMGGMDQVLLYYEAFARVFPDICEHRLKGLSIQPGAKASYTHVEPTPIEGVSQAIQDKSDELISFMGAPGYDVQRAMDFFDEHGDPALTERIRSVEASVGITKAQSDPSRPKIALMASNENPVYNFFLPLTAALWKKLGFTPYFVLVSNSFFQATPQMQLVLQKVQEMDSKIAWLPELPDFKSHNIAQVSRLFGACLDLEDEQHVMTSDADMWPLSESFFTFGDKFKLWNFADQGGFYMCYCCGRVREWRELMKVKKYVSLLDALDAQLAAGIGRGGDVWGYDESLLNVRLHESPKWPDGFEIYGRPVDTATSLPVGRVDRAGWDHSLQRALTAGLVDSHLVRPGYTTDNWLRIFPLFNHVAPELASWALDYYERYTKL